jgi:ERCC4-related helicase
MNLTPYHAKLFAYDLLKRRSSNDIGKLTASLQDAQVDLNPHQVDAALFAFNSPLSKGAILADEVGLGKTIEAGIILSQKWAERKRRLLIITPSNLRKQWSQELADKFFLPSLILEAKSFSQEINSGNFNPFDAADKIVICSYQFVKNKEIYVKRTDWDLVIIDEAHRLRNVYKPANKIGNSIKNAIADRKKVLLTATPLQNSILELYGLVSIIDEYTFGDLKSFKSQFSRLADEDVYIELRNRMQPITKRTLRRQVLGYIEYTQRRAIVEEFYPSDDEQLLYDWVSEYLQRPNLYALPRSQRQLMTLILRKLLASSSFAIYGTLCTLIERLEGLIIKERFEERLADEFDEYDDYTDEWLEEESDNANENNNDIITINEPLADYQVNEVKNEIEDLIRFRDLAYRIKHNTKADKLFTALDKGFATLKEIGANEKALIFTESKRTQEYLYGLLASEGSLFEGNVVLFNGTNNDLKSKEIYNAWLKKYKGTDRITGSPTADKRAALVDYFRETATIMIATEAAAEGINLQFCSLVVNYDLPWNPQRIEQRIGRCHRYGQKHDVVVVNFLNKGNAADQRVYQLLSEKFKLFDGVFGASDEVLGAIGSGMDFEKRIAKILLECRTIDEILLRFNELDEELKNEKNDRFKETKQMLLENVDHEVIQKLKVSFEDTKGYLNIFEQRLWEITKYTLKNHATFGSKNYSFKLNSNPYSDENIHPGPYMILKPTNGQRKSDVLVPNNTNVYRVGHPLAQRIIHSCAEDLTPTCELIFDYANSPFKINLLESYVGKAGWMRVCFVTISSFEDEDYIVAVNVADDGQHIDSELALKFFNLSGTISPSMGSVATEVQQLFKESIELEKNVLVESNAHRNRDFFDAEMDKLDQWAEDMKIGLQKEIEDLDAEIRLRKSEARRLMDLEEKVTAQRNIKDLEKRRSEKRMNLYEAQDQVDDRKEALLTSIEMMLRQKIEQKELFTIRWKIV